MELQDEIRIMNRQAFNAWDKEFAGSFEVEIILVGTLTARHARDKKRLLVLFHRWLWSLAKRNDIHLIVWFGAEDHKTTGKNPHIHFSIAIPADEMQGLNGDGIAASINNAALELGSSGSWQRGLIKIEPPNGGRAIGYACNKHDGDSEIMKIFCPKTGECSHGTKADKRNCKYRREPDRLRRGW